MRLLSTVRTYSQLVTDLRIPLGIHSFRNKAKSRVRKFLGTRRPLQKLHQLSGGNENARCRPKFLDGLASLTYVLRGVRSDGLLPGGRQKLGLMQ